MGFTFGREARLITLLVIDVVFFFIELITGAFVSPALSCPFFP